MQLVPKLKYLATALVVLLFPSYAAAQPDEAAVSDALQNSILSLEALLDPALPPCRPARSFTPLVADCPAAEPFCLESAQLNEAGKQERTARCSAVSSVPRKPLPANYELPSEEDSENLGDDIKFLKRAVHQRIPSCRPFVLDGKEYCPVVSNCPASRPICECKKVGRGKEMKLEASCAAKKENTVNRLLAATINRRLPVINSFTASPGSILEGETSILSWNVSNAAKLSINQRIGTVTGTTSRSVAPAVTKTYTLTASNRRGSVRRSVTVTVSKPAPVPTTTTTTTSTTTTSTASSTSTTIAPSTTSTTTSFTTTTTLVGNPNPPPPLGGTIAELPRVFIDTAYTPSSGTVITVNAGGNLQAALDSAQCGQVVQLAAGATFTGNFWMKKNCPANARIHIRSSAHASLPAGKRVSPSQSNLMAKIVTTNSEPALNGDNGSCGYRLIGLEVTGTRTTRSATTYALVGFGSDINGNAPSTLAQLACDYTLDRMYIHGNETGNYRRGVWANGRSIAIIDSHISEIHEDGADSQAICAWDGNGPFKIVNNHLEGAGENIMFGGATALIPNATPSDIEVRGNHIIKPLSWKEFGTMNDNGSVATPSPQYRGVDWSVKNLFELKHAQRVLLEGNILENNWADDQVGLSVLFTPRTEDGGNPWARVWDVTFRRNILRNVAGGFNISGSDDASNPGQTTRRINIVDNLIYNVNSRVWGGDGRIFQIVAGSNLSADDVIYSHNTALHSVGTNPATLGATGDSGIIARRLRMENNLVTRGHYGFFGSGFGEGTSAFNFYWRDYKVTGNAFLTYPEVLEGDDPSDIQTRYGAGNFFAFATANVGFTNFGANNFTLAANSPYKNKATDGRDIGADIAAVNAATATALSGQ